VVKKKEIKYVKISENANQEKFANIGKRVMANEVKMAYYAIEGNVGYFFYEIIK